MTIEEVNKYFTDEKNKIQTKLRGDIQALKDQMQEDQMAWEDMLSSSVRSEQKATRLQSMVDDLTGAN